MEGGGGGSREGKRGGCRSTWEMAGNGHFLRLREEKSGKDRLPTDRECPKTLKGTTSFIDKNTLNNVEQK